MSALEPELENKLERSWWSDAVPCSRFFRHWTDEEIYRMRRLAETHEMKDAAKILKRTLPAVAMKAGAVGISFRKWGEKHRNSRYPAEVVEMVRRENEEGKSTRKIAKDRGIPVATVQAWCSFKYRTNEPVFLQLTRK